MKKIFVFGLLLIFSWCHLKAEEDKAQWITAAECQNSTNLWLCFRHNFSIAELPSVANTRIAVDSKYWLWINGELVVFEGGVKRGPNPTDTYYDEIDLAPFLKRGQNSVAVLVWHFGKEGFSHNPSGKAGLFVECHAGKGFNLVSNNQWLSIIHPAYHTAGYPMPNYRLPESSILYDARYEIEGWQEPSFQPEGWKKSKNMGEEGAAPWNKLHPRMIPQWKNYGLVDFQKTTLVEGEEVDTLICRLPYNAQITPFLKVEAPEGKKIVILTDHYTGGGPFNVRGEYITREGIQEYESLGWMNGHQVMYCIPRGVKVLEVKYRETSYDADFAGSFECNDPFLNELWKKSSRTLMVTMRDTYMDCPDRERAQWWGDEVNESGEAFYALSSQSHLLMKKGMYELIGWQREDGTIYSPIPSSNFHSELPGQMLAAVGQYGFWNYYLNTGDKQPIADLYKGVKRYLDVWEIKEDGTLKIRKGGWLWGDWGTNVDKPLLFNEWYYLALKGAKNMADALDLRSDVSEYERKMVSFKEAFQKSFWNGEAYRSNNYHDDTDDRAQALAVVAGLADTEQYPAILEVLKNKEYASPYMEKYVTEALFLMGQEEYGLQRMKRRFSDMVNDAQHSTLYEGWGIGSNGYGGGTINHAWSGGGLTIMSQYICGVAPVQPGYKVFHVLPQPAGLAFAKAVVPSVGGEIKVSFNNQAEKFELNLTVPTGTSAVVGVPRKDVGSVDFNGKVVWKNGKYLSHKLAEPFESDPKHIKFKVGAGNHQFIAIP